MIRYLINQQSVNYFNAFALASIPLEEIGEITHPKYMLPEKEADLLLLMEEFKHIAQHLKKHNSARRRFKRWLKSKLHADTLKK
jgi:ribosomal protein S15P/S13E